MVISGLFTNQEGSVLGRRVDGALKRSDYLPYGQANRSPVVGRVAFNGQWREPLAEHYLLGNGYRSYAPGVQRFMQPDHHSPFNVGGINSYAYCGAEPVNRQDPSGRAFSISAIVGLVVSLAAGGVQVGAIAGTSAKSLNVRVRWGAMAAIVGAGMSISSVVTARVTQEEKVPTLLGYVGAGFALLGAGLRLSVTGKSMYRAGARKVIGRLADVMGKRRVHASPSMGQPTAQVISPTATLGADQWGALPADYSSLMGHPRSTPGRARGRPTRHSV